MELLVFLAAGVCSGVLAGMLGIGGGVVIVPVLIYTLDHSNIPLDLRMPLAVATSLAIIALSGLSSARAHHRRGATNWQIMKLMAPGCAFGAIMAGLLVPWIPGVYLLGFFALFELYVASDLLFDLHPQTQGGSGIMDMKYFLFSGFFIGLISTLLGIGGGSLTVPFLHYMGRPLREAVGTSSLFGAFLAFIASLTFLFQRGPQLPNTIGFIYIPAFVGIAITSILAAPLGALLAHHIPVHRLRQILAIVLYLVALDMGIECFKHIMA
jgi:uncharacterized membrane protein YfcA